MNADSSHGHSVLFATVMALVGFCLGIPVYEFLRGPAPADTSAAPRPPGVGVPDPSVPPAAPLPHPSPSPVPPAPHPEPVPARPAASVRTPLPPPNDPETRDARGNTPLLRAALMNNLAEARTLLELGADTAAADGGGRTPLHHARTAQMAELLLAAGAMCDRVDNAGVTPLAAALLHNRADVATALRAAHAPEPVGTLREAQVLVEQGGDPREVLEYERTRLHHAAGLGTTEAVLFLLEQGLDPAAGDRHGQTPLHQAASYDRAKVVEILLARGVPVDVRNKHGATPLHLAAHMGKPAMVTLLIDRGAEPDAADSNGKTPLHMVGCAPEVTEALLAAGADPGRTDRSGKTPLDYAGRRTCTHAKQIAAILERHANTGREPVAARRLPAPKPAGIPQNDWGKQFLTAGCGASWSMDGTRLVFAAGPGSAPGLRMVDLSGQGSLGVHREGRCPSWSPDGDRIAFVVDRVEGAGNREEVWSLSLSGEVGNAVRVAPGRPAGWSADGTRLYVYSPERQAVLAFAEEGGRQTVETICENVPGPYAAVSPDGESVALGMRDAIEIRSIGTGAVSYRLERPIGGVYVPAWSPDGAFLAAGGVRESPEAELGLGIPVVRIADRSLVGALPPPFTMPAWSPDGRMLAATFLMSRTRSIWVARVPEAGAPGNRAPGLQAAARRQQTE